MISEQTFLLRVEYIKLGSKNQEQMFCNVVRRALLFEEDYLHKLR